MAKRCRMPASVKAGAVKAHSLLVAVEKAVRQQIDENYDFDVSANTALVNSMLPMPGTDEAIGFSFVLAEYLSIIADGSVPHTGFKTQFPDAWKGVPRCG